jgi:hypothetical protein
VYQRDSGGQRSTYRLTLPLCLCTPTTCCVRDLRATIPWRTVQALHAGQAWVGTCAGRWVTRRGIAGGQQVVRPFRTPNGVRPGHRGGLGVGGGRAGRRRSFFTTLSPGRPRAAVVRSGGTIPPGRATGARRAGCGRDIAAPRSGPTRRAGQSLASDTSRTTRHADGRSKKERRTKAGTKRVCRGNGTAGSERSCGFEPQRCGYGVRKEEERKWQKWQKWALCRVRARARCVCLHCPSPKPRLILAAAFHFQSR